MLLIRATLFCQLFAVSSCLKVLFLSSVLYRSNIKVEVMIAKGLIANGDNVTVMAPVSYEDFLAFNFPTSTALLSLESLAVLQKEKLSGQANETFYDVMSYVVDSCDNFYAEPHIARFIEIRHIEYDVVIVGSALNECVLPVLATTEADFILLSNTNRLPTYMKYSLAIPDHPSYSPDHWSLNDKLSFTKRMKALFNYRKLLNYMHFWYYRSLDQIAYQSIPTHTNLLEAFQGTSAVLVDSNLAIDLPLPTFNNIIPIGGIHCVEGVPDNLPPDILEFANGAKFGVILVSFGSVFKPSGLPYSSLVKLVNVFSRVRQKVIWVFDDVSVIELSENVMPVKYINQQDVLAHPNVVLFVSHAGHFSRQEAIFHSVVTIVFPLFDPLQFANADYIHEHKIGIKFDINAFSEEMLLNGVMEVITNPKYTENMGRLSGQMRDVLVAPTRTAVYWIHYVARNKGAPYLRSHSMNLYWFQYYLIDVKLFVIVSTLLVLYVVSGIIIWCINRYKLQMEFNKQKQEAKLNAESSKKLLSSFKEE